MKVALIGATGFVGSAVLKELLQRGHEVVALVRDPAKLAAQPRLQAVQADVLDAAAVQRAVAGGGAGGSGVGRGAGGGRGEGSVGGGSFKKKKEQISGASWNECEHELKCANRPDCATGVHGACLALHYAYCLSCAWRRSCRQHPTHSVFSNI